MAAPIHPYAARFGLLLSAFALSFVAGELTCRILGLPFDSHTQRDTDEQAFARFDEELGWSYIPSHSTSRSYGDPPREIAMHFDEHRLRAHASNRRIDPDRPTLLFVGGSFTMGHGVFYEASFPARVAAGRLAQCQVANAGVQGFGTDQSLLALRRYLHSFETAAVVYTYMDAHLQRNGNRDRRLLYPRERFPGTKPLFALDDGGRAHVAHTPERYGEDWFSHLLALLRTRLPTPRPVELTRELIRSMRRETERAGAVFVAVDWGHPQGGRERPSPFGPLEAEGMQVLYTEDTPPPDWRYMVMPGTGHPSVQAHGHVANRLREKLRRAGVHCP